MSLKRCDDSAPCFYILHTENFNSEVVNFQIDSPTIYTSGNSVQGKQLMQIVVGIVGKNIVAVYA